MENYEHKGQLTNIDKNGDRHILYPETEMDCVHGLVEALSGIDAYAHAGRKDNPHEVTAEQIGAAKESTSATVVVTAASWTGDAAPYTATVATTLATVDNHLIVGAGGAVTTEQQEAMVAAMILCTGQTDGSITLSAFGDKPEIDLPVNIICVG